MIDCHDIAVTGYSGFIGSSFVANHSARRVSVARAVVDACDIRPSPVAADLIAQVAAVPPRMLSSLIDELEGCRVVLNAAGTAKPGAGSLKEVFQGNCVLPLLLQRSSSLADGTIRLVHVSSAAVQGSGPTIDETAVHSARSPYARSKAIAETALSQSPWATAVETIIYRATSVYGRGRDIRRAMRVILKLPIVPVIGKGAIPLPITTASSVSAALGHLARSESISTGIVVHPWEGVTQALLLDALVPEQHRLSLPERPTRLLLRTLLRLPADAPTAFVRRVELFLFGQQIRATRLKSDGFSGLSAHQVLTELA